jgi:hypothetical protein
VSTIVIGGHYLHGLSHQFTDDFAGRLRRLSIPVSFSGENWEQCLQAILSLIKATLEEKSVAADILKSRLGVGVGFVDGDLHIAWP